MSGYVEQGYSENYVEGDSSTEFTECDLSSVLEEVELLKQQNVDLNDKLDALLSAVQNNNSLNLEINSKLVTVSESVNSVSSDILSSVPSLDGSNLAVYPVGSEVITTIAGGLFVVESSRFIPIDSNTYTVVYTLSKEIDGVKHSSDFNCSYVLLFDHELYMLRKDCPSRESL